MSENNLQTRLRSLRGGQKKAVFARNLGISAQDYQRYEDGRIPRADILLGISEKTGVTVRWLLGEEETDQDNAAIRDSGPTPDTGTACRIPADCDVSARLNSVENTLASLQAEVHTLTRLLGARLQIAPSPDRKAKAG